MPAVRRPRPPPSPSSPGMPPRVCIKRDSDQPDLEQGIHSDAAQPGISDNSPVIGEPNASAQKRRPDDRLREAIHGTREA